MIRPVTNLNEVFKSMENSNIPKKKMAAIMAAVSAYIKSEEETHTGYAKIIRPSIWASSSREMEMRKRVLMQLRAFTGTRYF
jgi:hypothetical protein